MELGSFPDVPGRSHRKNTLIAAGEKHPFQKPATLIVKEVFVPVNCVLLPLIFARLLNLKPEKALAPSTCSQK